MEMNIEFIRRTINRVRDDEGIYIPKKFVKMSSNAGTEEQIKSLLERWSKMGYLNIEKAYDACGPDEAFVKILSSIPEQPNAKEHA